MKKILFFLALILIFPTLVKAQDTERIREFKTFINIQKDGVIEVLEYIKYDFGPQQRHGIYRNIPFIKKNYEGQKFEMAFKVHGVTNDKGKRYTWKTSWINEEVQVKIGDADKYVTGENIYVIRYQVRGALTYFSDHDEIYWNVSGNDWTVPIDKAGAEIKLTDSMDPWRVKLTCYTGPLGSKLSNCESEHAGFTSTFRTTKPLFPGDGLTVVVGFPKNLVSVLEPVPYVPFWEKWYGKLLSFVLIVVFGGLALFWYVIYPVWIVVKWYLYGRDPRVPEGPVSAWYDPPKTKSGRDLTPAEVGTLVDEVAHQSEISAMIVDLARRGHLLIEERKKKEFYFHKKTPKKADKLQPFERDFLTEVFKGGEVTVKVKDLKLATTVASIKNQLYDGLVTDGFFPKNPSSTRTFYYVIGVVALATFNIHTGLIAFIFGHVMPKKTIFGAQAANIAKSLRNFLSSQERQLKFQADKQLMFEKLLPFAVAFGVEKIWADRFKDVGLKQPDWYSSYSGGRFNSSVFAHSLNQSFASVARAATPTSSSTGHSSGFGGGGFSGGGGGGGGGGSW